MWRMVVDQPNRSALRVIDANFNRAREALRVMEEYARFELDDAILSSAMKHARHDLARIVQHTLPDQLLAGREIESDVGRDVTAKDEYHRASMGEVAMVAAKRLSEALRAIEEYGKTVEPTLAVKIEQLRYQGYELERRLALTTRARERLAGVKLYVLMTEALCRGDWAETAEAALKGGADCLQLREKNLSDPELLGRGKQLAELCNRYGALGIINDRPDVAALCGAHGVHVGQDDLSVADARRIVGPEGIVGISTHTVAQFESASRVAPDYIAVGPVFASRTKPQDHLAGLETLAAASPKTSIPLVAIGGINIDNAADVRAAGAAAICVCDAVIGQDDPQRAAAKLKAAIQEQAVPAK